MISDNFAHKYVKNYVTFATLLYQMQIYSLSVDALEELEGEFVFLDMSTGIISEGIEDDVLLDDSSK